jgi:hypothetical protein
VKVDIIVSLNNALCRELASAEEGAYDDARDQEERERPQGADRPTVSHAHAVALREASAGRVRVRSIAEAIDMYYAVCSGTFKLRSPEAFRAAVRIADNLRETVRSASPETVKRWPRPEQE